MKTYQLVIQSTIRGEERACLDQLAEVERLLEKALTPPALLDGHDIGSGESNVFIDTPTPEDTFEEIRTLVARGFDGFRAAYRDYDDDHYTILWPSNLREFYVT